MLYESFGTQNSMVTFICIFDSRKSQLQVKILKLGQISKFKIVVQNNPILCSFVQEFQKCHLFLCSAIRKARNKFQKSDVITLTCFLPLHNKARILLWNCVCVLFVCISMTYIPFFINGKLWALDTGKYPWKNTNFLQF